MTKTLCPECDYPLKHPMSLHIGQQIDCKNCHTKLTVVDLNPVELDTAVDASARKPRREKKRLDRRERQQRERLQNDDA